MISKTARAISLHTAFRVIDLLKKEGHLTEDFDLDKFLGFILVNLTLDFMSPASMETILILQDEDHLWDSAIEIVGKMQKEGEEKSPIILLDE